MQEKDYNTIVTETDLSEKKQQRNKTTVGLILIWAPVTHPLSTDIMELDREIVIGRKAADWSIVDRKLSRQHFLLSPHGDSFIIKDLGSRNGTFLQGKKIHKPTNIDHGAVIAAGSCVFILANNLDQIVRTSSDKLYDMEGGRYYFPKIARTISIAARIIHENQHVLVEAEPGAGKKHFAQLLSLESNLGETIFVTDAPALFADTRYSSQGLIYVDRLHQLSLPEQGQLSAKLQEQGASSGRYFVFSNLSRQPVHPDLLSQLYKVSLAPLRERRADIPSIFVQMLRRELGGPRANVVLKSLESYEIEKLCLYDYSSRNFHELRDLIILIKAFLAEGESAQAVVDRAIEQKLIASPQACAETVSKEKESSSYEEHKQKIISTYVEVGQNLSRLSNALESQGLPSHRRRLARYLKEWGIRGIRKRKK